MKPSTPAPARPNRLAGAFPWRDYDASTGRFTALDPLREKGGDTDWYGYCVDDPVNRVDVWGRGPHRPVPVPAT